MKEEDRREDRRTRRIKSENHSQRFGNNEKSIVVAGRHRRTLRTLAIESRTAESEKLENIGNIGTESGGKAHHKH